MPPDHVYSIYGCRIASNVPLPLAGQAVRGRAVDLEFELCDVPGDPLDTPFAGMQCCYESPFHEAGRPRVTLHRLGDRLDLRVAGCGRFLVSPSRIVLQRCDGTCPHQACAVLLNSVLSLWREQSGALALHAAAVADDTGRAFAICGKSGTGKSTLVRKLVADGFRFLSDDVLVLTFDQQGVKCHPGPSAIRLTRTSATHFGDTASPLGDGDKIRYEVRTACREGMQLDAIYLLERSPDANDVTFANLAPNEAFIGVLKNGFIGCLSERIRPRARLRQLGETTRRVSVQRLSIPDQLHALPAVSAALARRCGAGVESSSDSTRSTRSQR